MVVWEGGELVVEEGGSFKVWGRVGGWISKLGREFMGVVCGEAFVWAGRILAKMLSLLLGWGIE